MTEKSEFQFPIEFHWARDPKRRFKLQMSDGRRVIRVASLKDMREFAVSSGALFLPGQAKVRSKMLLAFAQLETPEDAVIFVNEYGPVTTAGRGIKGDPVSVILREAEEIREILTAAADQDRNGLLDAAVGFNFGALW